MVWRPQIPEDCAGIRTVRGTSHLKCKTIGPSVQNYFKNSNFSPSFMKTKKYPVARPPLPPTSYLSSSISTAACLATVLSCRACALLVYVLREFGLKLQHCGKHTVISLSLEWRGPQAYRDQFPLVAYQLVNLGTPFNFIERRFPHLSSGDLFYDKLSHVTGQKQTIIEWLNRFNNV